jgi:hypothetical protein
MSTPVWQRLGDIAFVLAVAALAIALGWRSLRKSAEPAALLLKWVITAVSIIGTILFLPRGSELMWPIMILIPALTIAVIWAPSLGDMVSRLLSGGMDGGGAELEPQPFYSIAETKRRNGHPQEAIQAVREQLAKFPGDFPGIMLLASIQAEDLNDLPGAQTTLERWMQSSAATPHGIASALTAIADWQLEFAQDLEAACAALERIAQTLPGTPLAHRAAQRLAHLPTLEHLLGSTTAATLDLRPGEKNVGLRKDYAGPVLPTVDPEILAESLVKQLEKHPADTAAREKLAVLYAEHFHRLDLAVEQLEQLINFPNESPRHVAQWLNLLADLHIRIGHDEAAAEAALRRILEQFSTPALVEPTKARLAALRGELKAGQKPPLKVLGQYEKNIGLKQAKG